MGVQRDDDDDPASKAAHRFELACRLVAVRNEELARLLSARGRRKVAKWAIGDWRSGRTDVPGWAMVAAEELAGIAVRLELPSEHLSVSGGAVELRWEGRAGR